jgi:hypothetical protein
MRTLCSMDIENAGKTFRNWDLRALSFQTRIGMGIFISHWLRPETCITALELKSKQFPKYSYGKLIGHTVCHEISGIFQTCCRDLIEIRAGDSKMSDHTFHTACLITGSEGNGEKACSSDELNLRQECLSMPLGEVFGAELEYMNE